jgi:hypothetical protein
MPVADFGGAITAPQRPFCESQGISLSLLTTLLKDGEIDSLIIGGRHRHVVLQSWFDYIHRKQFGLERDAVEREAAAARYRNSVSPAATLAAKRALAGKPAPGRPPGRGKSHGTRLVPDGNDKPDAAPWRSRSPSPAAAPKTAPGKSRSSRKESVVPAQ